MSASTKKIAAIAAGALVVLAIAGYLIGVPMWERSQAEKIRTFLSDINMKADTVDVSFASKRVTLTNLTGDFQPLPGMTYKLKIAKAEGAGINLSAANTKAVTTLVDSLSVTDFSFESVVDSIHQTGTLKEAVFRDVRLDLGTLKEHIEKKALAPAFTTLLQTLNIAQVTYVDYVVSSDFGVGPIVVSIAAVDAKDLGLLRSGPMNMSDLKVKAMGMDAFAMQSMSINKMTVPDVFTPLLAFESNPYLMQTQAPMIMFDKLKKEPLVFEGFAMKGLNIGGTLMPEPVTLDSFTLDMNMGADAMLLKSSLNNLVLPPSVLKQMGSEFAAFGTAYGKALDISGMVDFNLERKGDTVGFTVSGSLSDKNLGNGQGKVEFSYPMQGASTAMEAMPMADPALHGFSLNLKDTGFLPLFFDSAYAYESRYGMEEDDVKSGADMRRAAADELYAGARDATSREEASLATGFGDFIQKGGALNISVTAPKPVPLSALENMEDMPAGTLNVVVERTE